MSDVPNLGAVRPPRVYLAAIVIGVLLDLAMPLPFLPRGMAAGAILVVAALALLWYSVALFRAAGTPVPARKLTSRSRGQEARPIAFCPGWPWVALAPL